VLVDLTHEDVEALLASLKYSKDRLRNASETPYSIRQENLARLDTAEQKLRMARRAEKRS